jgi:hypothetical protein
VLQSSGGKTDRKGVVIGLGKIRLELTGFNPKAPHSFNEEQTQREELSETEEKEISKEEDKELTAR